jgi:heme-NO-binding protein
LRRNALHGLIFVTWEKYLLERFGPNFLNAYRTAIGETVAMAPLASRLYDDATLLAGVGAANKLSGFDVDTLLREYGRYFIINGLTSHLCTYVLDQVYNGRDLLLAMRNVHARLRMTREGVTPPLFNYEFTPYSNEVILLYDSDRHLCSVLWGAIEGAAIRYNEQVAIVERSCMKQGASVCRLVARFAPYPANQQVWSKTQDQLLRHQKQRELAHLLLNILPESKPTEGITLTDLQRLLQQRQETIAHHLRPAVLLEALQHLQFAGYLASTADLPGDNLTHRRYRRVRPSWE